jgi:hypothetical protein
MNQSTQKRNELRESSLAKAETNDCTVKALAVVTKKSYDEVHAELKSRGRKRGQGCNQLMWLPAVKALGCHYVEVTGIFESKTVKALEREFQKYKGKRFLVSVYGHVLGYDGHEVVDWTKERLHRMKQVWQVTEDPKDLMEATKRRKEPEYTGRLTDMIFWWYHELRDEYRIYIRENGKVRWLNSKWSSYDADDAGWRAAIKRGIRYEGELELEDVEQD